MHPVLFISSFIVLEGSRFYRLIRKSKKINKATPTASILALAALFDALYKEYVRPYLEGPVFLTDYPSEMIALAKRKINDPGKIASFQLLACGTELLKAYNELNDPKDQRDRWQDEEALAKKGAQNAMQLDEDYLRALEYGMPPTAGWGMGIDRLTQFLTDQPTIKDVILFPSMKNLNKYNDSSGVGLQNSKIIIGEVIEINKHPNADKLKLFTVKISPVETEIIISGCENVQTGDIVPVALINAEVFAPDNKTQKIKPTKMRGIESKVMMCSPLEIGLGSDHTGIYILPSDLKSHLGQPVKDHLKH